MARELDVPVLALSQLSRAVESRGGRPRLSDLRSSGCLAGDTLITRADTGERVLLRSLAGENNIPIFALDDTYTLVRTTMTAVFSSGIKQLFEMKTRSGRKIKASENHPFLTVDGWKRLDELSQGKRIAIPRALEAFQTTSALSNEEIILLAHLLGDGCILPRQPFHYTSADPQNLDIVSQVAHNLFSIEPRCVRQNNWCHVYLPSPYRLTHNKHHPITRWFTRLGLSLVRAHEKVLPQAIFQSSREGIMLFLHHLWATDGNISWKRLPGRKPAGAIYYATASKKLADDVQHLLLRLGIMSTLRRAPQGRHKPSYQVHVQGTLMQYAFCTLVGSFGKRGDIIPELIKALKDIEPNPNTDTIPKEVWFSHVLSAKTEAAMGWREIASQLNPSHNGTVLLTRAPSRARLIRLASILDNPGLMRLARSDVYWDEIVSVTPLNEEEVFDATVPGLHNFVANDLIVHNSIEQDADVVMFIHREDKYKDDSDKPNIAEIMIEKHRNGPTGKVELYFDDQKATFLSIDKSNFGDFAREDANEQAVSDF